MNIYKKLAAFCVMMGFATNILWAEDFIERQLSNIDFTDWTADATTGTATTHYLGEAITFSLSEEAKVSPSASLNGYNGYVSIAANKNGILETTTFQNVTRIEIEEGIGRGGGNGWKLEAKGDGDKDWVTLLDDKITSSTSQDINVKRTNVQFRLSNILEGRIIYLYSMRIFGEVPADKVPTLGTFSLNGQSYDATKLFTEQPDGTMTASLELSKTVEMLGESNPLQDIVAKVGSVKDSKYEGNATQGKATITIAQGEDEVVYILSATQKCDYTLTYFDTAGNELGKQIVEKDAKIAKFDIEAPSTEDGKAFRGWMCNTVSREKASTETVITGDMKLTALYTEVETANGSSRYVYRLNNHLYNAEKLSTLGTQEQYFYPEDHEGFNPSDATYTFDASFTGRSHGWLFKAGSTLDLLVGSDAYITLNLCSKTTSGATISMADGQSVEAKGKDEQIAVLHHTGKEGTVTLTFSADTYLHCVTVSNVADKPIRQEGGFYVIEAGNADQFLTVLEIVNAQGGNAQIFLPNGIYDLGRTCLTPITGNNISIIGQSMEGTIICNHPAENNESIAVTATLYNQSENLYLQDLTIKNDLDYYKTGSAGRAVCLMERSSMNTICKNVRLLSYQDTYYTHTSLTKNFYWEDSEIHGTVDYLCGGGNVVYNRVTLVNENRSAKETPDGNTTTAAPRADSYVDWGYVFLDCDLVCLSSTFTFGRSWGGTSRLNYIRTKIHEPERMQKTRFEASGMNIAAYGFYEYGTLDGDGNAFCPESNVVRFTHSTGNREYETILTEEEAKKYTIENIFGDWNPDKIAAQAAITEGSYNATSLAWNGESEAYAVFVDDQLVGITTDKSFKLDAEPGESKVTVRATNSRGGLGQAVELQFSSSIDKLAASDKNAEQVINLFGQKTNKKGLVIVNGKKQMY